MPAGRPPQFDEAVVLDRAMDFFWTHGYQGGNVADLITHVGIGRQTLYNLYGSKRGLFVRVIGHYGSTQLQSALDLLARPGSPIQNVTDCIQFFVHLAADKRARGCLVANAVVEVGSDDPEIANLLNDTLNLLEKEVHNALRNAKTQGELAPHKDPKSLASALTNAMIGIAVTGRTGKSKAALNHIYTGTMAMLA